MKLSFSVNTGPSFLSARRKLISEAPNKRISFSTWVRACGKSSLWQAKLYTCHGNLGRCRNDFYMQGLFFNPLG